jgi:hypothetical protein
MKANSLELQFGENIVIFLKLRHNNNKIHLELSFLTVFALPNASKSGFD